MSGLTSAEDALARAKAIAARLSSTTSSSPTTSATTTGCVSSSSPSASSPTGKRKRWGVAADPTPPTVAASLPGYAGILAAAKKPKVEPVRKRFWISTSSKPSTHFVAFLRPKLKEVQDKHNSDDNNSLQAVLKGRGSSSQPALPGIPEEPLHIYLEGPPLLVATLEPQMEALLTQAEQADLLDPPPDFTADDDPSIAVAAAAAATADKNSLALTTTQYRPATVAQLIGNSISNTGNGGELLEEQVGVPNGVVGFLIGRGGETIASLQARSGCKIQIQKEFQVQPGQTERIITLTASHQESIDQCRHMIETMVQDRIRASAAPGKDQKVHQALAAGHAHLQVQVPDADVGLIIGKMGVTIKAIQDETGANVQIPPTSNEQQMRVIDITHPTLQGAELAKQRIQSLLDSKPSYASTASSATPSHETPFAGSPTTTLQVSIPDKDVGLCIGRGGCVIKELQQKSGTRIQIPSQPTPGQPHRVATVTGPQEGCQQVQHMIERIIAEQSSASVMSGVPFSYGQPQPQQAAAPSDYSAEWAAYYAAQAVAQQQQQQQPAPAPAAASSTTDTTYHEQYFRYEYYYGEEAARKYYGAWSPPPGTPNPYGLNPNGITAPPPAGAPAPTAAIPTAAIPTAAAPVRDTSVRRVSNLPAWMTRGQTQ